MSHTKIVSEDMEEVLEVNLKEGNKKPPLFISDPGVGKDTQVGRFAANQGFHLIDYRVTQKTPQDVRGFPMPNRETKKMEYMIDEDFDFRDDKPNCLFINEMLNGAKATQPTLMQAVLDRRIGQFFFPKDTFTCAASNLLSNKTGVERMIAALADRFSIFLVEPNLDSYFHYLEEIALFPEVYAYLQVNAEAPYDYDIKKWDGESNFPTFRSFDRLGEMVNAFDSPRELAEHRLAVPLCQSKVGEKHGRMFVDFLKLTSQVGDVDKMLEDADRCSIPNDAAIVWLIACRLISLANQNNLKQVLTLAHRLTDPNKNNPDKLHTLEAFVGTSIQRVKPDLTRTKVLLDWTIKHGDALSGKLD